MTPSQQIKFNLLINQLWDGQCGEVEFVEVALDMGASLTAISAALEELRAEDGVS